MPVTSVLIQIQFKVMLTHYCEVKKRNVEGILEVDYLGVSTSNNGSWLLLIILLHAITLLLQAFGCDAIAIFIFVKLSMNVSFHYWKFICACKYLITSAQFTTCTFFLNLRSFNFL